MFRPFSTHRVVLLSALGFLASYPLIYIDWAPSEWLHQTLMPIDPWLQRITLFGDGRVLTPFCAVMFLILFQMKKKRKVAPVLALVSMALSGGLAHLMKFAFGRPRPFLFNDPRYPGIDFTRFHWFAFQSDFASFPSGHTTAVFSVCWVFISLDIKAWQRCLILVFALLVTLSRVALAKHFYADVLAGASLGIFITQLVLSRYTSNQSRLGI